MVREDYDPITIGERYATAFVAAFFGSVFGAILAVVLVMIAPTGTASTVFLFTVATMTVIGFVTPRAFGDFFAMFSRTLALLMAIAIAEGGGGAGGLPESDPRGWFRPFSVLVIFLVFVAGVFWLMAL